MGKGIGTVDGGHWAMGKKQFIRPQESVALYNSFNTLSPEWIAELLQAKTYSRHFSCAKVAMPM
jgi:hypothetical protein